MTINEIFDESGKPAWKSPPASPVLNNNEVHIWLAQLARPDSLHALAAYLSEDEQQQCHRYKVEKIRQRFISSRGYLRLLLAAYRNATPTDLHIGCGSHGKPFLEQRAGEPVLHFNLSHSGDLLLYAFSMEGETGIDIEYIHAVKEMSTIVRRFFSTRECDSILSLPHARQTDAFFSFWTRKEALIKANGMGFSMPLNRFSVPAGTGEVITYEDAAENAPHKQNYRFLTFQPQEGYTGSLAVASENQLQYCYWMLT